MLDCVLSCLRPNVHNAFVSIRDANIEPTYCLPVKLDDNFNMGQLPKHIVKVNPSSYTLKLVVAFFCFLT